MMIAPDRIWHEVVTTNNMAELSVFGTRPDDCNSENFIEYARVTPDTIPLPRAEVEALMEAAEVGLHRDNCPSVEFAGGQCDCGRDDVLAALATLQERMK